MMLHVHIQASGLLLCSTLLQERLHMGQVASCKGRFTKPLRCGCRNTGGRAARPIGLGWTWVTCIKSHGTTMATVKKRQGCQRLGNLAGNNFSTGTVHGGIGSIGSVSKTSSASSSQSTSEGDWIRLGSSAITSFKSSGEQVKMSFLLESNKFKANFIGTSGILASMIWSHSLAAASMGKTWRKRSISQFWASIGKKSTSASVSLVAMSGHTLFTINRSFSEISWMAS